MNEQISPRDGVQPDGKAAPIIETDASQSSRVDDSETARNLSSDRRSNGGNRENSGDKTAAIDRADDGGRHIRHGEFSDEMIDAGAAALAAAFTKPKRKTK